MIQIPPQNQKVFKDDEVVCFCFNYTKEDIENDFLVNNNHSKILDKIKKEKQNKRCDCKSKNPKGV